MCIPLNEVRRMGLVTQIGSAEVTTANNFAQILEQLGVRVSEPSGNAWSDIGNENYPAARYETSLRMFHSIAASSFHIIDNHGSPLDHGLCLQILYAMRNSKPVILTGSLSFADSVPLTVKETIRNHASQMFLLDPEGLNPESLNEVLGTLPSIVAYEATDEELRTIKYETRSHFRDLLQS